MTHHPECDGLMVHRVDAVRTEHGTFVPVCSQGCNLGVVGSAGSAATALALALARGHESIVDCDGRCREWET